MLRLGRGKPSPVNAKHPFTIGTSTWGQPFNRFDYAPRRHPEAG